MTLENPNRCVAMTASWWLHKRERNQNAGPLNMPVLVTSLAMTLLLLLQSSSVVFIYAAKSSSILLIETAVSFSLLCSLSKFFFFFLGS